MQQTTLLSQQKALQEATEALDHVRTEKDHLLKDQESRGENALRNWANSPTRNSGGYNNGGGGPSGHSRSRRDRDRAQNHSGGSGDNIHNLIKIAQNGERELTEEEEARLMRKAEYQDMKQKMLD